MLRHRVTGKVKPPASAGALMLHSHPAEVKPLAATADLRHTATPWGMEVLPPLHVDKWAEHLFYQARALWTSLASQYRLTAIWRYGRMCPLRHRVGSSSRQKRLAPREETGALGLTVDLRAPVSCLLRCG